MYILGQYHGDIVISEIRANSKIRAPSVPTLPGSRRFDCIYIYIFMSKDSDLIGIFTKMSY